VTNFFAELIAAVLSLFVKRETAKSDAEASFDEFSHGPHPNGSKSPAELSTSFKDELARARAEAAAPETPEPKEEKP
jgi:hypothetical protein